MFMLSQLTRFASVLLATGSPLASTFQSPVQTNDIAQCPDAEESNTLGNHKNPTLSFANSQWMWTTELSGGNAPVGSRGFRKTFVPPYGKTPAFLTIAYAADDMATLFVNGREINTVIGWYIAGTFCVDLAKSGRAIVIAFNATNADFGLNPAGLLIDGVVTYTDGSTSHIISDTTWRTSIGGLPSGFQHFTFDDSSWSPAVTEGGNGVPPWGNVVLAGSDPLSFTPARWIWTNEAAPGNYPPGARAFRYTLTLPAEHTSGTATVIIAADNAYSLYINGVFFGTGTDFEHAQKYVIKNVRGPIIVFAVYAMNADSLVMNNPAGLLATIEVTSHQGYHTRHPCISTSSAVTFSAWKAFPSEAIPAGFEQPWFDDSDWPNAVEEGAYGVGPWYNRVQVPTTVTPGGTPLPRAPRGSAPGY
ncbi:hypothetical protein F5880DRAFT_1713662 [Lentinula raphanica]|nr:hypothetical protein F5880DRAFT_1713662 [Lentinula raphanica]